MGSSNKEALEMYKITDVKRLQSLFEVFKNQNANYLPEMLPGNPIYFFHFISDPLIQKIVINNISSISVVVVALRSSMLFSCFVKIDR